MALTPEDVRNKQFSTAKRKSGYEMDEVDAFLDQVELELGALQRENAELRGRLAAAEQGAARAAAAPMQPPAPAPVAAPAPPPPAPAPVQNVSEQAVAMLALAQRTAEEHTTRARIEADELLASAQAKVAELQRRGQIDREALERRIEELRAFEREYRARLRQHYESALRELEGRQEAPAAAVASDPAAAAPAAAAPAAPAPAAPAPAAPVAPAPVAPEVSAPPAPAVHIPPPPPGYQPPAPTVPGTAGPTLTPPPPPAPNPFTPPPAQG